MKFDGDHSINIRFFDDKCAVCTYYYGPVITLWVEYADPNMLDKLLNEAIKIRKDLRERRIKHGHDNGNKRSN